MTVPTPQQPKRFYSADEVAQHLGLTNGHAVRRYARLGAIPGHRLGGRVLFKLDEVEAAISAETNAR